MGATIVKTLRKKVILIILAITAYLCTLALSYYVYNKFKKGLGNVNIIWGSMAVVISVLAGIIVFRESINPYKILAVVFSLLAITFAYYSHV